MMFDMLQHPVLNKRLAIVLLVKKNWKTQPKNN
jgi:hypothetical protein